MSEQEPRGPYVYQPYGSVTDPPYAKAGRLWGVGGVNLLATIKGLTKNEAERIVACLTAQPAPAREPSEAAIEAAYRLLDEGHRTHEVSAAAFSRTARWKRTRDALRAAYAIDAPREGGAP